MTKTLRLNLIRLGRDELRAVVTLARTKTHCIEFWMASAVVQLDGGQIEHSTGGHLTERTALLVLADWLLLRFDASSTRLESGSKVTLVAICDAP